MAFSFFKKKSQPEEQNQETGPQIIVPPAAVPQSKKDASPASPTADLGKPSLNLPTQKAPPSPDTASLSKPALKSPLTPPPAPENKAVPPTPAAAIPPASATKKLPLPKINLGSAPAGLPPAPPKPNLPQAAPGDLSMARMPSTATPPTLGSAVPLVKKPAPPTPSPSAQQPAAPLPPPAPAVDHVDIPLTVIAKSIPEDMLNSSAATEGTYRFDAKKMIEQLSLGKVSLTIAEIAENAPQLLADPSQHHDQIINLPLGEIVKIAPKGLLQKRAGQIEEKIEGEEIPTPFSEIAKKDSLKAAAAATPTPPAPIQPAPAPAAAKAPEPQQKVTPKPPTPPLPVTTPISKEAASTSPIVKTGAQPLPAMPISTVMLNKPSAGKPTIPIAPATTPISKSILTPAQRGVQPPNLLNKMSPSSLGAAPTTKSLLPQVPKKTEPAPAPAAPAPSLTTPPPAPAPSAPPPAVSQPEATPASPASSSTDAVKPIEPNAALANMIKKAGVSETGTAGIGALLKSVPGVQSCLVASVEGHILMETDPRPENQTVATHFASTYVSKVLRHAEPLNLSPIRKITIHTDDNQHISIFRFQNIVMIAAHGSCHLTRKASSTLNDVVHELASSVS